MSGSFASIAPVLIGLVVGTVVGLTSMGGGALLTPALVVLLRIPASVAIGSDVLIAATMKVFGAGAYALRGQVHWPTVGRLAIGSVPGALLGVAVLNHLPRVLVDVAVGRALGVVLLLAALATVHRVLRTPAPPSDKPAPSLRCTVVIGLVTGFLVATTSVGSGSILILVLAAFFPLRAHQLVGTDLAHALLLLSAATIGHLASHRVDFTLAASVLAGAIPGVILGARLAGALPERALRTGLALILFGIGLRLSIFGAVRG